MMQNLPGEADLGFQIEHYGDVYYITLTFPDSDAMRTPQCWEISYFWTIQEYPMLPKGWVTIPIEGPNDIYFAYQA